MHFKIFFALAFTGLAFAGDLFENDTVKAFRDSPAIKSAVENKVKNSNGDITYQAIATLALINDWLEWLNIGVPLKIDIADALVVLDQDLDNSKYLTSMARSIMHGRGFDLGVVNVHLSDEEYALYQNSLIGIGSYKPSKIDEKEIITSLTKDQYTAHANAVNGLWSQAKVKNPVIAVQVDSKPIKLDANELKELWQTAVYKVIAQDEKFQGTTGFDERADKLEANFTSVGTTTKAFINKILEGKEPSFDEYYNNLPPEYEKKGAYSLASDVKRACEKFKELRNEKLLEKKLLAPQQKPPMIMKINNPNKYGKTLAEKIKEDKALEKQLKEQIKAFKKEWNTHLSNITTISDVYYLDSANERIEKFRYVELPYPNGEREHAEEWKVQGDGDCAFRALGISRKWFIDIVKNNFKTDPAIKNALKVELAQFVTGYYEKPDDYYTEKLKKLAEKTNDRVWAFKPYLLTDDELLEFFEAYYVERGDYTSKKDKDEKKGNGFLQVSASGAINNWTEETGLISTIAKYSKRNIYIWLREDVNSKDRKKRRDLELIKYRNSAEQNELDELNYKCSFVLQPQSRAFVDKSFPNVHIRISPGHFNAILLDGDTENFCRCLANEIESLGDDMKDDLNKVALDILENYPLAKQLYEEKAKKH